MKQNKPEKEDIIVFHTETDIVSVMYYVSEANHGPQKVCFFTQFWMQM
jgi:hypothetical protein